MATKRSRPATLKQVRETILQFGAAKAIVFLGVAVLLSIAIYKLCTIKSVVTTSFTASVLCDDGNYCTLDGYDHNGRCVHSFLPHGHPCESPCGTTATCQSGVCVPSGCDGSCETVDDCPLFFLYNETQGVASIEADCVANVCIYESYANDVELPVLPGGNSLLAQQICMKSAMGITGFRDNTTNTTLDFDGDMIVDGSDPYTAFDPLDQPLQTVQGSSLPGPDTYIIGTPSYMVGWRRVINAGTCCGIYPLVDIGFGELVVYGANSPIGSVVGRADWDPAEPSDMSGFRYFRGEVFGDSDMDYSITIEMEDDHGTVIQSTVISTTTRIVWSVDLDTEGFDKSVVTRISIIFTLLIYIDESFVYVDQLHFTPDPPIGTTSINECVDSVPKYNEGELSIQCVHWFKCACTSTNLAGLPLTPAPTESPPSRRKR